MNKSICLIILLLTSGICNAQSFFNGDFENNTSTSCDYNNTDSIFNTKISNVYAFGKAFNPSSGFVGETDIQTFNCYVSPQHGNWCIGLASDSLPSGDAVAIELTSNLITGHAYQLSFYAFGNTVFFSPISDIQIGESLFDTTFGNLIYQATPSNIWTQFIFNFYPSQPSQYITARIVGGLFSWNQIDNFTITDVTGINGVNEDAAVDIYPNPILDKLNITTKNNQLREILLYDITSRKIFNQSFINSTSINTEQLAKGIYLYEVRNKSGVIKKGKVVKE